MKTRSENEKEKLNESLALTNAELLSNWTRLAKLIRFYELIEYDLAQKKALELIKTRKALGYIEAIREEQISSPKEPEQKKTEVKQESVKEEPKKVEKTVTVPPPVTPPFELNNPTIVYDLLVMLAPTLKERVIQKGKYWGVAKKRGYKDVSLELTQKDRTGYYLKLVFYKNRVEDGADIELHLHFDIENQNVEPLTYKDEKETIEVYQDRYKRDMLKPVERRQQSDFLFKRLNRMLEIDYLFEHDKSPIEKLKNEQMRIQHLLEQEAKFRENINDFIPNFEVGNVQLTEAHIRLGLKQIQIDLINKTESGLIMTPKKPRHEYENPLEFKCGFRIDRWGKVYFKGRSERA